MWFRSGVRPLPDRVICDAELICPERALTELATRRRSPSSNRMAHVPVEDHFPNHIGDALEIVVYRCLQAQARADRTCSHLGSIYYRGPKRNNGRYRKVDPPTRFRHRNNCSVKPRAGAFVIDFESYFRFFIDCYMDDNMLTGCRCHREPDGPRPAYTFTGARHTLRSQSSLLPFDR
jgi:hypothetical protein